MADERISSFVTDEAINELLRVDSLLESVAQNISELNASAKRAEGLSAQSKSLEDVATSSKKIISIHKDLADSTDKAAAATKRLADAQAKAAAAAEQKAAINKVADDSLKALSDRLNDLRKGYERLTAAERDNANIGGVLLNRIKELDTQLKATDASMGRFQRNVGNYAGSIGNLRGSIQQIARELPSLGNGFQTFTMAIGNNIAPAAEAIANFRKEQSLLRAEGKASQSVFSALSSAVFNWQSLLLVGVTLLITYSREIKNLVIGTNDAADATKRLVDYTDDLGDSISFTNNRLSSQNKLLQAQAKERGASAQELSDIEQKGFQERLDNQEAFIKTSIDNETHYQTLLTRVQGGIKVNKPGGGQFSAQDITDLLEKARKQTSDLIEIRNNIRIEAQIAKANANAAIIEADKRAGEKAENDLERLNKQLAELKKRLNDTVLEFGVSLRNPSKAELEQVIKDTQKEIDTIQSSGLGLVFDVFDQSTEEAAKKKAADLLEVLNRNASTQKGKPKTDPKKEEEELRKAAEKTAQDAIQLGGELDRLQQTIAQKRIDEIDAEIKKIEEKKQADIDAVNASLLSQDEKARRIAEINANADAQEKKLEHDKIERQRKAAVLSKAITISQIIAQTALAIVKALAEVPWPYDIAEAAIVGAIGAAQVATVIATPLPQYEEGTQGKPHKGGKAVMFEGNKAEAVFEPGKMPWIGTREGVYDLAPGSHVVSNKELMGLANMYTLGMPALIPANGHGLMDSEGIKQGLRDVQRAIESKPSSDTYWTWQGVINQTRINGNTIQRLHNLRH